MNIVPGQLITEVVTSYMDDKELQVPVKMNITRLQCYVNVQDCKTLNPLVVSNHPTRKTQNPQTKRANFHLIIHVLSLG